MPIAWRLSTLYAQWMTERDYRRADDHDGGLRRGGDRASYRALPYVLTAILGGGGFSMAMPMIWPSLYPTMNCSGTATALSVDALQAHMDRLETALVGNWIRGPEQVREKLNTVLSLQREMMQALLAHDKDAESFEAIMQERHERAQEIEQ